MVYLTLILVHGIHEMERRTGRCGINPSVFYSPDDGIETAPVYQSVIWRKPDIHSTCFLTISIFPDLGIDT